MSRIQQEYVNLCIICQYYLGGDATFFGALFGAEDFCRTGNTDFKHTIILISNDVKNSQVPIICHTVKSKPRMYRQCDLI